jgi:hypothetical protein
MGRLPGKAAAAILVALAGLAQPALAQGSAQGGNVGPSSPATPGLAVGSTTGGASGGTVNRQATAPNGRANELAPASRSFSLRNYAGQPITDATATMTDGSQHKLTQTGPIAAAGASQIVVPLNQCLADVKVQLKDGKSFHSGNLNDCRVTQIMVNGNGIQIGSTQSPGAQTSSAAHRP